jgi:hypothetical protein
MKWILNINIRRLYGVPSKRKLMRLGRRRAIESKSRVPAHYIVVDIMENKICIIRQGWIQTKFSKKESKKRLIRKRPIKIRIL